MSRENGPPFHKTSRVNGNVKSRSDRLSRALLPPRQYRRSAGWRCTTRLIPPHDDDVPLHRLLLVPPLLRAPYRSSRPGGRIAGGKAVVRRVVYAVMHRGSRFTLSFTADFRFRACRASLGHVRHASFIAVIESFQHLVSPYEVELAARVRHRLRTRPDLNLSPFSLPAPGPRFMINEELFRAS